MVGKILLIMSVVIKILVRESEMSLLIFIRQAAALHLTLLTSRHIWSGDGNEMLPDVKEEKEKMCPAGSQLSKTFPCLCSAFHN